MKLLHSADWHLDSPLAGRAPEQAQLLRQALLELPSKVTAAAKAAGCDLILLSGDLFDGPYTAGSLNALKSALAEAAMPVFIAPGNHDPIGPSSPWDKSGWPENVHIFTDHSVRSVSIPELDCRIYGAAFTGPEASALMDGFRAECPEQFAIGLFHGDPTQSDSPYNPISVEQVKQSGLDYLALGHIHKSSSFRAGSTLCAWPGCPMGRGFDELGPKGVLIVTLDDTAQAIFQPLEGPKFYDLEVEAGDTPAEALARCLPAAGSTDFYRITLTGECASIDVSSLSAQFSQFPHLELRDRTVPPLDLWCSAGHDTLEGLYFAMLRDALEGQDEASQRQILLAARIARQILNGQEVALP